jgi:hypothetical protein
MKSENNRTSWAWQDTFFYCDTNVLHRRPKLKKQRAKHNRAFGKFHVKNEIIEYGIDEHIFFNYLLGLEL